MVMMSEAMFNSIAEENERLHEQIAYTVQLREEAIKISQGAVREAKGLEARLARWLAWSDGRYPDDSPGDVIAAAIAGGA